VNSSMMQKLENEVEFEFVRSSGAGGQNVNKVNSKAVMRWNVLTSKAISEPLRQRFLIRWQSRLTTSGELIITSSVYRDQIRNKDDAFEKLLAMVEAVATPPKKRTKTKPTRGSKERRIKEKQVRAKVKSGRRFRLDD
jgi:ribosome-associated protein